MAETERKTEPSDRRYSVSVSLSTPLRTNRSLTREDTLVRVTVVNTHSNLHLEDSGLSSVSSLEPSLKRSRRTPNSLMSEPVVGLMLEYSLEFGLYGPLRHRSKEWESLTLYYKYHKSVTENHIKRYVVIY